MVYFYLIRAYQNISNVKGDFSISDSTLSVRNLELWFYHRVNKSLYNATHKYIHVWYIYKGFHSMGSPIKKQKNIFSKKKIHKTFFLCMYFDFVAISSNLKQLSLHLHSINVGTRSYVPSKMEIQCQAAHIS
jgi:hypothetical protein